MTELRISSQRFRSLVRLLLLLPLLPTALIGWGLINSFVTETKQILKQNEEIHQARIQSTLTLLEKRQRSRGEVPPISATQPLSEKTKTEFGQFLDLYDGFVLAREDGTVLAGKEKKFRFAKVEIDASSTAEGATLTVYHNVGWENLAMGASMIRASFLLIALAVIGVFLATLLVGRIVRRQLRIESLKSDFLATVSHELKTPIASSRILIETLREEPELPSAQVQEYAALLLQENERMENLVSQFLTFSRLDAKRPHLALGLVSPAMLATLAADEARPAIEAAKGELLLDVPASLPAITANEDALLNILSCFLDNGRKYGGQSSESPKAPLIELAVAQQGARVVFSVKDNGAGISKEDRDHIFEPFFQANSKLSRSQEGCGLGLAIAKKLADSMNAPIQVETKPNEGTTFSITFPTAP